MAIIHTLGLSYSSPTGTLSNTFTATGDSNLELNLTIAPSSTHAETDFTLVATSGASGVQSLYMVASAAMTVYGNSVAGGYNAGDNQNTITLVANVPYFWITGDGTSPIAANWAAIYVTSTAGGSLQIRALQGQ